MLHPVILSGGSGSRLWPLSRTAFPKQLLTLISKHSMLQDTILRLKGIEQLAPPSIMCNQEHRFLIAEQLREIDITPQMIMLEPVARNTAPAITTAALQLASFAPDDLMLVLPADHVITDVPAFHQAIEKATAAARQGYLVTFGINARKPETGYGYIQCGATIDGDNGAHLVRRFVEKPDSATAEKYLSSGDYYWNSGIFLFGVQSFLDAINKYCPDVFNACQASLENGHSDLDFYRLDEAAFAQNPAISIDFAVMEKADKVAVVPVEMGWSDVGSFSALWEVTPKDDQGNATVGETYLQDAHNCYVNTEKCVVAAVGVDDLIIVETADAILVAHKDHDQDVKKIVQRLEQDGRTEHHTHRKVYRPWGTYEGIERGERFQVKQLIVKPGEQSSMQKHFHRSEHWVVVSGTAEVTIEGEVHLVLENESIYIPQTAQHRIHNPGHIPLHFIEVQSGAYLSEDDIVRTEDNYGREKE
ncbi:MAG: mannose-1-phosphate guanylyltransferase/mannose-6-phosphate isomerase [Abditibacteriaceae bacterium]